MTPPGSYTTKVLQKTNLTPDVILLQLEFPQPFSFQAGQFITLFIEHNSERKPRSYSILNPPSNAKIVDLCIKIIDDGFASEVFRKTKVGDLFTTRGPFGHFILNEHTLHQEQWFIGAGTGIAPLYSILKKYLPITPKTQFHLLFGTKTKSDILFHEEFLSLAKKYPNFHYTPTLTREKETWKGATGHVQQHLPQDSQNKIFYICGLKELVLETKQLLLDRGADSTNIHFERYN